MGELINFKVKPINKFGEWRRLVLKLCDLLYCFPEDLFTEAQREMRLKANRAESLFTEHEMMLISTTPETLMIGVATKEKVVNEIDKAILKLPPRYQIVIKNRFGIGGEKKTLAEIGQILNVGQGRVRQIEHHAIRKLRYRLKKKITPQDRNACP